MDCHSILSSSTVLQRPCYRNLMSPSLSNILTSFADIFYSRRHRPKGHESDDKRPWWCLVQRCWWQDCCRWQVGLLWTGYWHITIMLTFCKVQIFSILWLGNKTLSYQTFSYLCLQMAPPDWFHSSEFHLLAVPWHQLHKCTQS